MTSHSAGFLAVLATLLRTVSAIDGLVCLYAVVQMLSLTAFERRTAVATLRACGARPAQLHQVGTLGVAKARCPFRIDGDRPVPSGEHIGCARQRCGVGDDRGEPVGGSEQWCRCLRGCRCGCRAVGRVRFGQRMTPARMASATI